MWVIKQLASIVVPSLIGIGGALIVVAVLVVAGYTVVGIVDIADNYAQFEKHPQ
jgi:hypothetical protein